MVILNKNEQPAKLETGRFAEILSGHKNGVDVLTGTQIPISNPLTLAPKSVLILEIH
jgi:hypothetical protein